MTAKKGFTARRGGLLPILLILLQLSSSFSAALAIAAVAAPTPEENASSVATTTATTTTTLREYLMRSDDGTNENDNGNNNNHDVYLAMGPAFFGFFGYFGALAGMEDALFLNNPTKETENNEQQEQQFDYELSRLVEHKIFRGVAGASAGAMAAILLAAGIPPHRASSFVSTLGLSDFADPGGLGGILKGDRFEALMTEFLHTASPLVPATNKDNSNNGTNSTTKNAANTAGGPWVQLHLEQSLIPVAVSAVDILPRRVSSWWSTPWSYIAATYLPNPKILSRGSMARAARASACFPGLFQPVGWLDPSPSFAGGSTPADDSSDGNGNGNGNATPSTESNFSLLVDGGIFDWAGYNGLKDILQNNNNNNNNTNTKSKSKVRVLNMVVGGFGTAPPGPKTVSETLGIDESDLESVLSLSIVGLPHCGPLAMANGPLAVRAARFALREAMDRPIAAAAAAAAATAAVSGHERKGSHHYVLEIDASAYASASSDVDESLP